MRVCATVLAAAGIAAACGAAWARPDVFKSGGTDQQVTDAVNAFRASLGALNPNNPGSLGSGRREINWDAVGDPFASPNAFPGNFLNANVAPRARGAQFTTPGHHMEVSANAVNPTNTPKDFAHIDPSYLGEFREFSAQRLFTAVGSNIVDVTFHIPGEPTPALVRGFGAVFSDVNLRGSATMEFFSANNALLATKTVPASIADHEGFSFLGVDFGNNLLSRVRITSGTTSIGAGVLDLPNLGIDLAVMDDFIFGEPVAVPAPGAAAVLGLAGLLGLRRRR